MKDWGKALDGKGINHFLIFSPPLPSFYHFPVIKQRDYFLN